MQHFGKALMVAMLALFSISCQADRKQQVETGVQTRSGDAITVDGSTTVGPLAKSFAAYFTKTAGVSVTVSESGSGNGAKSLINNTTDIASMSREMKPAEVSAAKEKGINPIHHVVALDGLAMVVHPSNPVSSLTKEQIADIYAGTITRWSQVGGPDVPIVVIQRESNSGTQESFKELVMGKDRAIVQSAESQASNGAVKNRISQTNGSIGFLGLGFVDQSLRVVKVNGVTPSVETVQSGTYPLSRPLYFVTNGEPQGKVKDFVNIPETPEGQRMVTELGFVPKQ